MRKRTLGGLIATGALATAGAIGAVVAAQGPTPVAPPPFPVGPAVTPVPEFTRPAVVVRTPSALPTATPRATPLPLPTLPTPNTADGKYPPTQLFLPRDNFDFGRLPAVDTLSWTRATSPSGALSIALPTGWRSIFGVNYDVSGKPIGETLKVLSFPNQGGEFVPMPGWVWMDISTSTVPATASIVASQTIVREVVFDRAVNGGNASVTVWTLDPSGPTDGRPGAVFVHLQVPAGSGAALFAAASIALPADSREIAIAMAVVQSVVAK